MTLTSHGHHISGTLDTDEPEKRNRARCGGERMCETCGLEARYTENRKIPVTRDGELVDYLIVPLGYLTHEWQARGTQMLADITSQMKEGVKNVPKMQKEANASGSGELTKDILIDLLDDIPGEAVLRINSGSDPREGGSYWSVRATYGESRETTDSGTKIRNFSSPRSPSSVQQGQFGDH